MDTSTTTIRTRLGAALAALLVTAAVVVGAGQPAAAADFTVIQGQALELPTFPTGDEMATVDPVAAGTVEIVPGSATFFASTTFVGSAEVCVLGVMGGCWTIQFAVDGDDTASAQGSFVPVAAPGPCILLTANQVVSFGDVTLGGPFQVGNAAPTVAGCAEPSVIQDVLIEASSATNGETTLQTDTSCLDPVDCNPGEGFYAVALPDDGLVIRSSPSLWLFSRDGDFPDESATLAVKMPATLAPTSLGSIFTFDVIFTAVVD
ncbi:MAG TPA: hypothetical protein VK860_07920 [Ilumatobacteraceae bacterium]|nr:hypothetical protein [Ilumatobacteraceae bacterium]